MLNINFKIIYFLYILIGYPYLLFSNYSNLPDSSLIRINIEKYNKFKDIDKNKADSIIKEIRLKVYNINDIKLQAYSFYCIADHYSYSIENDSVYFYINKSLELCEKYEIENIKAKNYILKGILYSDNGLYEESIGLYNKALSVSLEIKDSSLITKCYANIGVSYYFIANYEKAIGYYLKSLKILEEIKDSANISVLLSNLAVFYQMQNQYDKSINTLNKSLSYTDKNDYKKISSIYNNLVSTYIKIDSIDKALYYNNESLRLMELNRDFRGMAVAYNNMAEIYRKSNNVKLAIEYLKKAILISEKYSIQSDIPHYYRSLGVSYFDNNELNLAAEYTLKSIDICKIQGNRKLLLDNYFLLADIYRADKKYEKSTELLFIYKELNDSIVKEEYFKNIAELDAKYQAEKKEKEIIILNKDNQLKEEKINKQNVLIYSFITGFLIIFIFSIIILRLYNLKKKANIELELKNAQIYSQKEEIEAQRDEIEEQKDYVIEQRDTIMLQKKELTDSIHYAKRIQSALLPLKESFDSLFENYFIIYFPRDIVSGDFYWIKEHKNKIICTVADCTGHGVPGAFMSMLGIAYLNEIINNDSYNNSAEILNQIRTNIVLSLHQAGKDSDSKDGMDISLCIIDKQLNKLQFSGANNPLYLIRRTQDSKLHDIENDSSNIKIIESSNSTLFEIKGDKMPIAIYDKMEDFTTNYFDLFSGDTIYLFSDGFADQFGGENGKKYMYKKFKNLLIESNDLDKKAQCNFITSELNKWMNYGEWLEQTDDITIIGLKI